MPPERLAEGLTARVRAPRGEEKPPLKPGAPVGATKIVEPRQSANVPH